MTSWRGVSVRPLHSHCDTLRPCIKQPVGGRCHGGRGLEILGSQMIAHVSWKAAQEQGKKQPVWLYILWQQCQHCIHQHRWSAVAQVRHIKQLERALPRQLVAGGQFLLQLLVRIIHHTGADTAGQLADGL
jgi:hypothetical protein